MLLVYYCVYLYALIVWRWQLTDDYHYDTGNKPNNNEAFENIMAARKRVTRRTTARDVTSGKH